MSSTGFFQDHRPGDLILYIQATVAKSIEWVVCDYNRMRGFDAMAHDSASSTIAIIAGWLAGWLAAVDMVGPVTCACANSCVVAFRPIRKGGRL
jgi:hypothetical protein